ncbi:hypothetical protein E3N88_01128 [Mikania micrantha]|uniref:Uncharacterized protein n=1 Tax=Mikania micrantha TaxID=192012 RepID=A0A5N6Q0D8_9ASTR|nr:hypothetical protein E3N88_01128 [Mikania micrantha]
MAMRNIQMQDKLTGSRSLQSCHEGTSLIRLGSMKEVLHGGGGGVEATVVAKATSPDQKRDQGLSPSKVGNCVVELKVGGGAGGVVGNLSSKLFVLLLVRD